MPVPWYDKWKTTPPEEKVWGTCDHCGQDIYEGEDIIEVVGDKYIHANCFDEYAREELIVRWFNAGD